jgi:hypothetical protein
VHNTDATRSPRHADADRGFSGWRPVAVSVAPGTGGRANSVVLGGGCGARVERGGWVAYSTRRESTESRREATVLCYIAVGARFTYEYDRTYSEFLLARTGTRSTLYV